MKSNTVFYCTACGNETPRWQGQCPSCGAWNTISEMQEKANAPQRSSAFRRTEPHLLSEVDIREEIRFKTGMQELDRVLGGGAVKGSLVLVGGAPGIGKSTLLLQICTVLGKKQKVLYVSGEESEQQMKLRADRLGVRCEKLLLLSETNISLLLESVSSTNPDILIVDSIQTMFLEDNTSAPGSVSQVKDCTMTLMDLAKGKGVTVFVVGHVNKEGAIAGPKVLEHMVDCVLYFEGDRAGNHRILRAAKNRFGSTNEIGVFEMVDHGLKEIPNPSQMLLSGRPKGAPGTCVTCAMEGTRPVLAEIQVLVTKSALNNPRRTADGFDHNRAALLLAVAEKRGNLKIGLYDAYINVIGGLKLDEPAADLALMLAAASSYRDKPLEDSLCAIGEIGLTGEVRSVTGLAMRLEEARRNGFTRCVIPRHGTNDIQPPEGLELIRVRNILEAIEYFL